jgi:F-type H+-transporting ATPase subunit b
MLETLGINPILLIAQIISFGIVYFVLNKFLFPQVKKALDERRAAVEKTFADQTAIETRLKEFDEEQKVAQKKAAEDVQKMLADAKDSAAATKADLVAKAREAADAEVATAKVRIDQEKQTAEAEVAKRAKDVAQSIVKELLAEKAGDAKWQDSQVKAGINTLKQVS